MSRTIHPFQVASLAACALVLGAAACTLEDIDQVAHVRAALDTPKCEDLDCGKNTGEIEAFPFKEFHTGGMPNSDGFRVHDFSKNGTYYTLDVEDGEFRALGAGGQVMLSHGDLVGSTFLVDNGQVIWEMEIAGYTSRLQDWVEAPEVPGYLSAYRMRYRRAFSGSSVPWVDLCKDPQSVAQDPGWLNSGYETYVVLIEGELYDYENIAVRQDVDPEGWVSIPCAGTALAKMMLMRYDPARPEADPYHTTFQERQAALKMITADVCGIGYPFTVTGQPLLWANDAGWHDVYSGEYTTVEAVWDENGARCLDMPRLEYHPDFTEAEIKAEILDVCGKLPPSCSHPSMNNWTQHGEWKTYNPS